MFGIAWLAPWMLKAAAIALVLGMLAGAVGYVKTLQVGNEHKAAKIRELDALLAQCAAGNARLAESLKTQSAAVQALVDAGQRNTAAAAAAVERAKQEAKRHQDRAAALEQFRATGQECDDLRELVRRGWEGAS